MPAHPPEKKTASNAPYSHNTLAPLHYFTFYQNVFSYMLSSYPVVYKKNIFIHAQDEEKGLFRVFRSEQNAFVENNDISPLREKAFLRVTAL